LKIKTLTLSKLKQPTGRAHYPYSVAKLNKGPNGTLKNFF
jgi:hypothetical protein